MENKKVLKMKVCALIDSYVKEIERIHFEEMMVCPISCKINKLLSPVPLRCELWNIFPFEIEAWEQKDQGTKILSLFGELVAIASHKKGRNANKLF